MFDGDAKKRNKQHNKKSEIIFFSAERRFPCHSAVYDGIRSEERGGREKKRGLFGGS